MSETTTTPDVATALRRLMGETMTGDDPMPCAPSWMAWLGARDALDGFPEDAVVVVLPQYEAEFVLDILHALMLPAESLGGRAVLKLREALDAQERSPEDGSEMRGDDGR